MSAGATSSTHSAPMVTDEVDSSPLRELVRDGKGYREVEMEDAGSVTSDSGSEEEEEEKEKEWEGKGRGRPNFKRAVPGAGRLQSTPEFFRHGYGTEVNIFDTPRERPVDTPGKTPMRGALARSLSAAARSPQQVGTAETLNCAKSFGQRGEGEEDWADAVANEMEIGGVSDSDSSTTPTPAPARWPTPTPVPVTPTKGSKRLARGTPRPGKHSGPAVRLVPAGLAAASALEQILAAIAGVELRMGEKMAAQWAKAEEKIATLEARMMQGMTAMEASADGRMTTVLVDAEEREKRVALAISISSRSRPVRWSGTSSSARTWRP